MQERILRGAGAGVLGQSVTGAFQVFSVPLFLYFWGPQLYGEWLILSAIPTYLRLCDVGIGDVSGTEMTMRVAAGDRRGALEVFQSAWVLTSCTSFALALGIAASVWFLPLNHWLHLTRFSSGQTATTMLLLSAYVLVGIQGGPFLGGFKSEGNFPTGLMWINWIRLFEYGAATLAVCLGGGPAWVACAYLLSRGVGIVTLRTILKRRSPWLTCGTRFASTSCIRRLLRPAIAYMAFPAGNALSLEGMLILIGRLLGPMSVVVFSTIRTLTRMLTQVVNVIRDSLWPEISAAFGSKNCPLARRLHRYACQASLWLSGSGCVVLFFIGPTVFRMWTRNRIDLKVDTFHTLLVVAVLNSFWYTSAVVTLASNTHERVARAYLTATAASLVLAYSLIGYFGLLGAAVALLISDALLVGYVLRTSLASVSDCVSDFALAIVQLQTTLHLFARYGQKAELRMLQSSSESSPPL